MGTVADDETETEFAQTKAGLIPLEPFSTRPRFGTVAAINRGFSNPASSDLLPKPTCSTGNCTWPVYTSLAYCSACHDVSESIKVVHGVANNSRASLAGTDRVLPNMEQGGGNFTNYTLAYSHMKGFDGFAKDYNPFMTAGVTADPSQTISFKDLTTMLITFGIFNATKDFVNNRTVWESSRPTATECAIYYCVKSYNASSSNSVLTDEELGSWAERVPQSFQPSGYSTYGHINDSILAAYAAQTNSSGLLNGTDVFRTDLQLKLPNDVANKLPRNMRGPFNISQGTVTSTINFLKAWATPGEDSSLTVKDVMAYPDANDMDVPSTPMVIEALWSSTNLSKTFDDVARSMTLDIRQYAPTLHNGTAQQWILHIKVQWTFLVLPVVTVALGCAYIVLTLLETTHLRVPVWKEGATATLAYGLSEESQAILRNADAVGEMRTMAKSMMLGFDDEGDGSRLHVV